MKAAGNFFTLAFAVCCCLSFGLVSGLKCYSCASSYECRSPKKVDCTYNLANAALSYLNYYYLNVPSANTTRDMNCLRDWLQTPSGPVEHWGCIYSSVYSCTYSVRPQFQQNYTRSCHQCNRDGCNPATRAGVSLFTIVSAIIVTVLASAGWCR